MMAHFLEAEALVRKAAARLVAKEYCRSKHDDDAVSIAQWPRESKRE